VCLITRRCEGRRELTNMRLARRLAEGLGVYDRLRYSRFYEWLLRYRNPAYVAVLRDELAFYRRVLAVRPVRLIFDVGAHFGDKASVFRPTGSYVSSPTGGVLALCACGTARLRTL